MTDINELDNIEELQNIIKLKKEENNDLKKIISELQNDKEILSKQVEDLERRFRNFPDDNSSRLQNWFQNSKWSKL